MHKPEKKSHRPEPRLLKTVETLLIDGALPGEIADLSQQKLRRAAEQVLGAANKRTNRRATVRVEAAGQVSSIGASLIVINDDMPFLVDSIAAEIASKGLTISRILHPVMRVVRDNKGTLQTIETSKGSSAPRESFLYVEIARANATQIRTLEAAIKAVLTHVRRAVQDWRGMQKAMRADAAALKDHEGAELLHWFGDNNFTMLGHIKFPREGKGADALGICGSMEADLLSAKARISAINFFEKGGAGPLVIKSNLLSPIHRRVPIELVVTPVLSGKRVTGLSVHAGLWTSAALSAPPESIPVLRKRLAALQRKFGFDPLGHAGKALSHAMSSLPRDLLIAMTQEALEDVTLNAMSITDRPRPSVTVTASPLNRHVHAYVWLPRDEVNTGRRLAIAAMLSTACEGQVISWGIDLDESGVALFRYVIDIRDGGKLPASAQLSDQLRALVQEWKSSLEIELVHLTDTGKATQLLSLFGESFPQNYRDATLPDDAARDVIRLANLGSATARDARLFADPRDPADTIRLKLYSEAVLALSDTVPVLENFGFRIFQEFPTSLSGELHGHVHEFTLTLPTSVERSALIARASIIEGAVSAVLRGEAENDRFNDLIVSAEIAPFDVVLFRAWFRYLRQAGQSFGLITMVDALRRAPSLAQALTAFFHETHNPAKKGNGSAQEKTIEAGLSAITSIEDDRIIRMLRAVVRACLRTNAFSPQSAEALAFKFESAKIPGLPAPVPWREIFVYSPRVEGIHLRAGPVARGGLRWSDRRDDFRTEILGLMKAQRVKNAVIVPTGAKGGFYPKQLPPPSQRDDWLAEGKESYRIFIRTLLSITDNIVEGKVVHPASVRCLDGDDPYFVVAADKGTATFSDVANAIALAHNFWLGDAFASGGSVGYDHKAMGITARGGWVSVRRHFAEMGVDIQSEPVRVAGCGDMSGDVFGNGMLLSKAIKLVAAFDHRHFFFDPDPDPAKSHEERQRMFNLPRSSWEDYDAKLISKGGGVFSRTAKTIKLTPEIRKMLGLDVAEVEPSTLLSAILKADVDLMWFGGIGTYVKARSESNAEVGDRANDAHRVNAEDLRCKVIGEGANLGMTQDARIAFGLRGGRCNTDFIDNSAGVDCSDNEVNIKIALNTDVASGKLTMKARNALLVRMTDDVAALVLEDNRLQTLALSIAYGEGTGDLLAQIRIIENLEANGRLDRAVEGIASNDELLRRLPDGKGLTRAELAVLLATAKLAMQDGIELTHLGSDPATLDTLMHAFPAEMRRKHAGAILSHRLRAEIIATKLSNRIINRMGIVHPFELAEEEGATLGDVAQAFVVAEQLFDIDALWAEIDGADVSEATRLMLYEQTAMELRAHMADILRNAIESRSNDKAIAAYHPIIAQLSAQREALLPQEIKAQTAAYGDRMRAAGAPPKIVDKLVRIAQLDGAIGLAALAARNKIDALVLTRAFATLGSTLGVDWAQGVAMQLNAQDPWERLLAASVARDFQAMRLDFIGRMGAKKPEAAVSQWLSQNEDRVKSFRSMINRARVAGMPTPAMLAQIAGQARVLLSRL